MKKIIMTTGCAPGEEWQPVLDISVPRFKKYAALHGYDFQAIWYTDICHDRFPEFHDPGLFDSGAVNYGVRQNFIRWKLDRSMLAPNWLRYAAVIQLLGEYDLVLYFDSDVVIADFSKDVLADMKEHEWLAAPIVGPSPDNAGPGGPVWASRSRLASKAFWLNVWKGQLWKSHPLWTDGVDFMDMLGYTITPPVHKVRATEYDQFFYEIPRGTVAWYPARGPFIHAAGGAGSGDVAWKIPVMRQIAEEVGE